MKIYHLFPILGLIILPCHADFELKKTDQTVEVLLDGKPFTTFEKENSLRKHNNPYLYPLPSPSGANLARHWPVGHAQEYEDTDHLHQHSFWLAFGDVNGFDFWAARNPGQPEINIVNIRDLKANKDSANFTADLEWVADGKRIMSEERSYHIHKPNDDTYLIDVDIDFKATDGDVTFGETKEGFFAIRMDRTLRSKGRVAKAKITDSEGRINDKVWGKSAKWVAYAGPDEIKEPTVVAMFDNPKNFRYPTTWHARDYGLFAINPFGGHDFDPKAKKGSGAYTIKNGESLKLRYRVLLHHGDMKSANLEHWSDDFAK